MNPGIKLRLAIFIAAVALLLMLIGWTAHGSWARIGELHERLAAMQWKSFQTSDHLQQAILDMNNLVLRYAAYRESDDWTNFLVASKELNTWINAQQPILSPAR